MTDPIYLACRLQMLCICTNSPLGRLLEIIVGRRYGFVNEKGKNLHIRNPRNDSLPHNSEF